MLAQNREGQALSVSEMVLERGGIPLVRIAIDLAQGHGVNTALGKEAFTGANELSTSFVGVSGHWGPWVAGDSGVGCYHATALIKLLAPASCVEP